MLRYSVLIFLLQLLCYTAFLHTCKIKSNWVSPKETACPYCLNICLQVKIRGSHFYLWFRMKPNFEALEFSRGWDAGFWLPLFLMQLWDGQWCWWCLRNRTEGAQHTTWPGVSALYHSIQVLQKLNLAASLENSLLTCSSCLFFSNLLIVFLLFLFQGLFHSPGLLSLLSLLNAPLSVMVSVGSPYVG